MGMYNPPIISVHVGTQDGDKRKVKYTIIGTDAGAISRTLETLGFVFDYKIESDGTLIFRNRNQQRAWYTQVKDHNPEETPTP